MESVNYWLIEMNPETWDISKCALGFRQTLDSRNKAGALKPRLGEMKTHRFTSRNPLPHSGGFPRRHETRIL